MTRVREWKPGDVAMVTAKNRLTPYKAIYVDGIWVAVDDIRPSVGVKFPVSINSLVTLDPEDREQVERLVTLWSEAFDDVPPASFEVDFMQTALREFADPKPHIEEPTGLGAVAEMSNGDLYIRDKTTTTVAHWKRARGEDRSQRYRWADLNVVRVLSEGVTA